MKLYHGTASYNLESFTRSGPQVSARHYIGRGSKRAFCTTISFDVASVFAFRKTPIQDMTQVGIVLEFDGSKLSKGDFLKCKDPIAMHDEKEVSIFKPEKIKLVAYWKFENNWQRIKL